MENRFSYCMVFKMRCEKLYLFLWLILMYGFPHIAFTQNLVTNGDFETYNNCPNQYAQISYATGWAQPANGTPDYYHTCSPNLNPLNNLIGSETPYSGNAFAGIVLANNISIYREYIQRELSKILVANQVYYFEMYVSLGDSCNHASDQFGVHFSNDSIRTDSVIINRTPQITAKGSFFNKSGWTKISGLYKATGGEKYITIGNFSPANTPNITTYVGGGGASSSYTNIAYYYIDDVALIDPTCDSIPHNNISHVDIDVCNNVSSFTSILNPTHTGISYLWSDSSTNNQFQTKTIGQYWVYVYTANCPYVDTFTVRYIAPPILDIGADTTLCSDVPLVIKPRHAPNVNFLWSNGSTDSMLSVKNNGVYWTKITAANGCSSTDSINVNFVIMPEVLGKDIDLCGVNQFPVKLSAGKALADSYLWNNLTTDSIILATDTGIYWVQINKGGCNVTDTILIKTTSMPAVMLGNDTTICIGNTINLIAPVSNSYKWYKSINLVSPSFALTSLNNSLTIGTQGLYLLEVKRNTCIKRDTLKLQTRNKPAVNIGNDTLLCYGSSITLNSSIASPNIKYLWQNGDTVPQQLVSKKGMYWIKVRNDVCEVADSINIDFENEQKVNLGNDTAICSDQILTLSPKTNNVNSFKWYNGSTNNTSTINHGGIYWVEGIKGNCKVRDSIKITYIEKPVVNLGPDTLLCSGQSFTYRVSYPEATYLWNNNSTDSFITDTRSGNYWVEINNHGCKGSDTVKVNVLVLNKIELGNDTALCEDDVLTLKINNVSADSYIWNTGETDKTIKPKKSGIYWAEAKASICKVRDTIIVIFKPKPVVNLGNDTTICTNAPLVLNAKIDSATYLWDNLSTAKTRKVNSVGYYTVAVTRDGCTATDDIVVTTEKAPALNLGNDTTLCTGYTLDLNPTVSGGITQYLWQDNSTLPYFSVKTSGTYSLTIKKGVCYITDSVKVSYLNKANVNLGNDTDYCFNNAVTLKTNVPNANTYLWQDGSTKNYLQVNKAGLYWVELNSNTCKVRDSVFLTQKQLPVINLGNDKSICKEESVTLDALNAGAGFVWEDFSTTQTHKIKAPGLFYVTVTNNIGCYASDTIKLDTFPTYFVNIGADTFVCEGSLFPINTSVNYKSYLWQDGSTAPEFVAHKPGEYFVTVTNQNNCTASDTIILAQKPKPFIHLERSIKICEPNFTLNPDKNFISYLWQDGSTKNSYRVLDYGTYKLTVTDSNYCTNDAQVEVINFCPAHLAMPNAFTPNADLLNDQYKPVTKNVQALHFKIYNRWGQLIFETQDPEKGWDGKLNNVLAESDVYFYSITYVGTNQISTTQHGDFTLLR